MSYYYRLCHQILIRLPTADIEFYVGVILNLLHHNEEPCGSLHWGSHGQRHGADASRGTQILKVPRNQGKFRL